MVLVVTCNIPHRSVATVNNFGTGFLHNITKILGKMKYTTNFIYVHSSQKKGNFSCCVSFEEECNHKGRQSGRISFQMNPPQDISECPLTMTWGVIIFLGIAVGGSQFLDITVGESHF